VDQLAIHRPDLSNAIPGIIYTKEVVDYNMVLVAFALNWKSDCSLGLALIRESVLSIILQLNEQTERAIILSIELRWMKFSDLHMSQGHVPGPEDTSL
jgi:hypothetical protein